MNAGNIINKIFPRPLSAAAVVLAVMLSAAACGGRGEAYKYDFFAADTYITLELYGADDPTALCSGVEEQTAALERILSRTDTESELYILNASPAGDYRISDTLAEVLSASLDVAATSGGAYDPTVAPLVDLWNNRTRRRNGPRAA